MLAFAIDGGMGHTVFVSNARRTSGPGFEARWSPRLLATVKSKYKRIDMSADHIAELRQCSLTTGSCVSAVGGTGDHC